MDEVLFAHVYGLMNAIHAPLPAAVVDPGRHGILHCGQALAYLYFEDEPQRQLSTKRLSRDEAFLIAVNIAKLPSVSRQILKDIPRPPNTASRDD